MSIKEEAVNNIAIKIADTVDCETEQIRYIIFKALENYEITIAEKSLAIVDSSDYSYYNRFLISKKIEGLSENSLRFYKSSFDNFYKWLNHRCSVLEVTTDIIRAYLADMMISRNWSKTNTNNNMRNLSSFYSWLSNEEIIARNPLAKVKQIKEDSKRRAPFTRTEVEKLRQATDNKRDRAIIEFLLSTGCRVGEIEKVKIKDIDFVSKELTVLGKGSKSRTVFLNDTTAYYIKEYLLERNDSCEYLFVSLDKPHVQLHKGAYEIVVRTLGRKVGVKAFPHKFRHTAATWALQKGMPIEQIQKMLGHSNLDTTLIYAKTDVNDLKHLHQKYMN